VIGLKPPAQTMLKNFFRTFGVQSKLIALVLSASLVSLLFTGFLSFGVARHLLSETGYERLTAMRGSQAVALSEYVERLGNHVMTLSEARMTVDAAKRFTDAFNQLPDINEAQKKQLRAYYDTQFIPKLKKDNTSDPGMITNSPDRASERYIKYHYIVSSGTTAKTDSTSMVDAKDGSAWTGVHQDYHERFARLAQLFDYQDIMLADIKTGNIVYNTSKEDDLGTNLLTGPYANSAAAKVFQAIKKSKDPFFITFSDFSNYAPSLGRPTMLVGTSVFDGDNFIGALIFQLTNKRIDNLMTSNRKWREVGMGASGETYLVGQDTTFRSSPRFFLESPKQYLKIAQKAGLSQSKVEAIRQNGTPILVQPVKTVGALNALAGKTGTTTYRDYRGIPVVASYQPIQFGPMEWGLLAEIDEAELFSGVGSLTRNLLLLATLLIPALAFLTLWMARAFIRPVRHLLAATEKISSGDYNVQIPVAANDEFGDLATAFNTMSNRLDERERSLQRQVEENQRLLLSILPGSAASRLGEGAKAVAESHPNVTVLFAEIEGWNDLSQSLSDERSMRLLNELTIALDDTVKRFDVEKLQDVGTTYLAVSGLSRLRVDHEKRAVDCGLAMLRVMRGFNRKHNVRLFLDISLHAGPLTTGVVRGERLSFDIWGQTIHIARGINDSPKHNVIQVSSPIVETLRGLYTFKALPPVTVKGQGEIPIWEVVESEEHSEHEQP
jgi:class 3 adenylate cyclase